MPDRRKLKNIFINLKNEDRETLIWNSNDLYEFTEAEVQ